MKSKSISKEEYIKEFCRERRIRDRKVIYVSASVHDRLRLIAHDLHDEYITLSSLADTILYRHLETYDTLFEQLRDEAGERFLASSKKFRVCLRIFIINNWLTVC